MSGEANLIENSGLTGTPSSQYLLTPGKAFTILLRMEAYFNDTVQSCAVSGWRKSASASN